MNREEITATLDRAFEHMFAADFVSAAACLRHLIDHSGDPQARAIAKRDLEWWCLPLEAMLKHLQHNPYPMTIEGLLKRVRGIQAGPDYAREVAAKLSKMAPVIQFSKRLWMYRTHFERAVSATLAKLDETQLPSGLGTVIGALLLHLACQEAEDDPVLVKAVREEVLRTPGLLVLDDNCVFRTADLEQFRAALVAAIGETSRPARLRQVTSTMPWPRLVQQAVRIDGLKRWLYSQRVEKLTEIADGWWSTEGTPDFTHVPLDRAFQQPFEALSTETVLLRYLFSRAEQPQHLVGRCLETWGECLAKNLSVTRLAADLWIPAATVTAVARQIAAALQQATEPQSYERLVSDSFPRDERSLLLAHPVKSCVLAAMRQDSDLLELSDQLWLHRAPLRTALDLAYEMLGDGVPRSSTELLSAAFGSTEAPVTRNPALADAFERALQEDSRFLFDGDKNVWLPVAPGYPNNNPAYIVLHQAWSPLSRSEIVKRAKALPCKSRSAFDLESDRRFKRSDDGRWMLAPWTLINELAAQYLMSGTLLLDAATIKARVCELHHLDLANAIFLPEEDPRFHSTSLGKWYCDVPDKTADADVLDRLVRVADESTEGLTLEGLVQAALNDSPKNYRNLQQILLDDGRLLLCEGLWYSRTAWFYHVTDEDMAGITANLTQTGYPLTAEDLAQTCLHRRLGLTDLAERLRQDPQFVAFGTAGWTLTGLQPPSAGLPRDINYPIHSGKYLPELSDHLQDQAEEASAVDSEPGKPPKPPEPDQVQRPVRFLTIALEFEDIRDGSLVVKSHLRRLYGPALKRPAVRFTDEGGNGFSCWYDADNRLLHGFGNWFGAQDLTFGDKITLAAGDHEDLFTVRATGERNEAVHQAGLRRQEVHTLIEDAKRANRSYHDLALEVLEHFGAPLHIDDLWQMVNYRRIARKNTLSAILSTHSYFVSDGAGHWHFDREEYTRMMLELERRVKVLEKENQRLRDAVAEPSGSLQEADREAVKVREEATALQAENQRLQVERDALAARVAGIPALTAQLTQLEAGLQAAQVVLQNQEATGALLRDDLRAANERAARSEALAAQVAEIPALTARLTQLEEDLQSAQVAMRDQKAANSALRDDLRAANERADRSEALAAQASARCKELLDTLASTERPSEQVDQLIREQESRLAELQEENRRLTAELAAQHAQLAAAVLAKTQHVEALDTGRRDLQYVRQEAETIKQQRDALESDLTQARLAEHTARDQLNRLQSQHAVLRTEHSKAMGVLDSWPGRIAKWWAARKAHELPAQLDDA